MVSTAMIVIGVAALMDKNVTAVSTAFTTVLVALGLAELREIKSQTNGNNQTLMDQNRALMDELAQYRRDAARITDRALDSAPLVPAAPGTTTTTTTAVTTSAPTNRP